MKKYIIFIIFVLVIIIGYNFILTMPKSYKLDYQLDEYTVQESYDKKLKIYTIAIKYLDKEYTFIDNHKYTTKRKNVSQIEKVEEDDTVCLAVNIFNKVHEPLCYQGNVLVDATLSQIAKFSPAAPQLYDEVNNIKIYNKDYAFYVWNNHGISNVRTGKTYNFLADDNYNNALFYANDKYIIFPDYQNNRAFDTVYLYDYEKDKLREWHLEKEISYDAYFMGEVDNLVYLYDKKNKKQYSLNLKKLKIKLVSNKNGGMYYDNGQWEDISLDKLTYDMPLFQEVKIYNYTIEDNQLFLSYATSPLKIKVSNQSVTAIIRVKDDKVFYLCDDSLYEYSPNTHERLLLNYYEWHFSYIGKIFIFN